MPANKCEFILLNNYLIEKFKIPSSSFCEIGTKKIKDHDSDDILDCKTQNPKENLLSNNKNS